MTLLPSDNIHTLTFPDTDSAPYSKARYHYLLQIIFGETVAIDYCVRMASFSPSQNAKDFLLKQQEEENVHLEMLTEYVGLHPRPEVLISKPLRKLHAMMEKAIGEKDYVASAFIQNFVVEGLNVSLLKELEHHTDSALSELCSRILQDEITHVAFGVSEIKNLLIDDTSKALRKKLVSLHRKTTFQSALLWTTLMREASVIGIPVIELTRRTLQEHMDRVASVGFMLPFIDRVVLNGSLGILRLIE